MGPEPKSQLQKFSAMIHWLACEYYALLDMRRWSRVGVGVALEVVVLDG